jgi:ABC-2 type transport system ATP-binding protein
MSKLGYPIIELKSLAMSLEDIFLQIVTKEKEEE